MNDDMRDMVVRMDENIKHIKEWTGNHDCTHKNIILRIDVLEQWKWKWVGAMALGGVLLSLVGRFVANR